ncbi:hypothetical protein HYG81_19510 (plasmid) [Natrinema zhouii]|uniref:hypothetical protein n=1 Tax=Natrinema zhouii TaxID=1710539 RepID=UPI001CFF9D11|nr:hypothetical protein [Natrinema zhouii]UHQ98266.1 hypothetical protein HYG81_19510 [Natrinema zhouii]
MYSDTESVVEFAIPHPEKLKATIAAQDSTHFDCLEVVISDHERRYDVLTEFQERIEDAHVLANQLHPREGIITDVPPECNPEDDHNDGKIHEHLHDMARSHKDAHLQDFEPVVGFEYWSFWYARTRVLEWYESGLEPWNMIGLDVASYPDWTHCQACSAVAPGETFLHVDLERRDVTRRVFVHCFVSDMISFVLFIKENDTVYTSGTSIIFLAAKALRRLLRTAEYVSFREYEMDLFAL